MSEIRLSGAEIREVKAVIENEGIDYGLNHYTDFKKEVQCPEFHRVLLEYQAARRALLEACGHDE